MFPSHDRAIIFGLWPNEKHSLGHRDGLTVYSSDLIEKAWTKRNSHNKKTPIGSHEFGSATFESCAYVARYIMKKITGDENKKADHYCKYLPKIDTWIDLEPEFALISKGLGRDWFNDYKHDLYDRDEQPIPGRGIIGKPAKYYDRLFEKENPERLEKIKTQRRDAMAKSLAYGPSLESRAKVEDAKWNQLKRPL